MECQYCHFKGSQFDFEEDFINHKGFWCPMCDCFTYYEGKADYSNYHVVLEKKSQTNSRPNKTRLKKRLSPLRYPGGKSKMIDMLLPYIDFQNKNKIDQFVEVFCGGASMGLSLLEAGLIDKLVLNDKDINVVAFWKIVCGTMFEELIELIWNYTPCRDDYFKFQQDLKEKEMPVLERAFKYYVINRCSFSGIFMANPMKDISARWKPATAETRIRKINSYSSHITVCREDALPIIQEYYWGNNILFIDPPYFQKGDLLYKEHFTPSDHENLADLINQLVREAPGCSDILITYDYDDFIKMMYGNFQHNQVHFLNRKYSIR